jgi:hypothetical protein
MTPQPSWKMQSQESFTKKTSASYDITYLQDSMASDLYASKESRLLCFSYACECITERRGLICNGKGTKGSKLFSLTSWRCFRLRLSVYVSGLLPSARRVYIYCMNYCCKYWTKVFMLFFVSFFVFSSPRAGNMPCSVFITKAEILSVTCPSAVRSNLPQCCTF